MTENTATFSDTQQHKYTAALFGYGGPNCGYEVTLLVCRKWLCATVTKEEPQRFN